MSGGDDGERKLIDARAEYRDVERGGERVPDADWRACRLVLTTRRFVLGTDEGNRVLAHGDASLLGAEDLPEGVDVGSATPFRLGDAVVLLDAGSGLDLERAWHRARFEGEVVLARPRAVVGGVVAEDATWRKARPRADAEELTLRFPDGDTVALDLATVGSVERSVEPVAGEERTVVAVEHADGDASVETHLSGTDRTTAALGAFLDGAVADRGTDYELSETERQVLVALYSGVSPFEMAEFVGVDVDEVEETYRTLLEVGAVDEVRTRTEVSLNATGRNLASEAMSEK